MEESSHGEDDRTENRLSTQTIIIIISVVAVLVVTGGIVTFVLLCSSGAGGAGEQQQKCGPQATVAPGTTGTVSSISPTALAWPLSPHKDPNARHCGKVKTDKALVDVEVFERALLNGGHKQPCRVFDANQALVLSEFGEGKLVAAGDPLPNLPHTTLVEFVGTGTGR